MTWNRRIWTVFRQPSVVALLFVIWTLVASLGYAKGLLDGDGDLARHIVLGRHVFDHGVVFPDVFSNTKAGETFVAYEWLSEIILAAFESIGGLASLVLLSALIIGTSIALVASFLGQRVEAAVSLLVGNLVAVFTYPHWIARPHLFSFLCLALLLVISTKEHGWKRNLSLVILFAFWANLHPGFLYGLFVFFAFLLGDSLDTDSAARRRGNLFSFLGASVGTLINPLGVFLHLNILHHLKDSLALGMVEEFHPPEMASTYGILYFTTLSLVILAWSVRKTRVPFSVFFPFVAAVFAGFAAVRNIPLFALFALPLAVSSLSEVLAALHWKPLEQPRKVMSRDDSAGTAFPWVTSLTCVFLVLMATSGRIGPYQVIRNSFSPSVFPVSAVEKAREAGLDDLTIFNEYTWGGFILYAWPEQTIYIDGMANFFGGELMGEYISVWLTQEGWKETLDNRGIDLLIVPPEGKLAREARRLPTWTVWFEDATAVVLMKVDSAPEASKAYPSTLPK